MGTGTTTFNTVEMLLGVPAHEALSDIQFLEAWRTLHENCSHATGFQSPKFVCAWYDCYRIRWQPVVVRCAGLEGKLAGLWLLAYDPIKQLLSHAGAHQAEYHAWLALPDVEAAFLASALAELQRRLRFATLRFKYLPDIGLVDKLRAVPGVENRLIVTTCPRPLAKLSREEVKSSFAKKSNKSRFNRLKRLGDLTFRRITEAAELEAALGDLIAYYDFRQAAVNDVAPFHEDPLKRNFHSRLFAAAPDETHVTITYLDARPIAALWGTVSGNTVHLGMLIYSPMLAEYSPGKLHVMQLEDHLLNEGKAILDLTPGGDPWKERFANAHDEVSDTILYRSVWARRSAEVGDEIRQWVKRGLSNMSVTPSDARSALVKFRRARPSVLIRRARRWAGEYREFRVYRVERAFVGKFCRDVRAGENSLSDLLAFEPWEAWQTRESFLSSALSRLESGESVYTISIDNRLAHAGWLVRNQTKSYLTEVQQAIALPPGSVALYDYFTHPNFRGRGLYRAMIQHMLHEAFADEATQYAFISVLADNLPSRHVIEDLGFQFRGSLYWKRRFGVEKKWADPVFTSSESPSA